MKTNILMQDKVASTITIINQYLKMALRQAETKNPLTLLSKEILLSKLSITSRSEMQNLLL